MLKEINDRDLFIEHNLGLVRYLCARFSGRGLEYVDCPLYSYAAAAD